ncbi:polysaccharide deacetylase [Mesorhizobium sp.]|uniref:polysaccharide deacetylase family protein n=1 Tax=Mesorhizobium sp. TaxID=1871066 RepID=UPI000FEA4E5D|nr:polysaccharide deacetylase [Mesorhizobium sp.]RWB69913.1 MAG: polysaccharide deacetylase [Mesorhizobium sp.]
MPRHIVCLSFDFDAWSGFAARGMLTPTPISRGEFGAVAASRILDLLGRWGIKSSWFIPGVVIETYRAICERIVAEGHEIGHHGWSHVAPANMTPDREAEEFDRAVGAIQLLTGRKPNGYRSPSWDLSHQSIDLMLQHGIRYDSSMMGHDCEPYYVRRATKVEADRPIRFGPQTDLVEMPISWSLDDYPHFEYSTAGSGLSNANAVLDNWVTDFEYMRQTVEWGALIYTFHPFVIGRGHRMTVLTKLIETLKSAGAVFITVDEVHQEFRQRQPRDIAL